MTPAPTSATMSAAATEMPQTRRRVVGGAVRAASTGAVVRDGSPYRGRCPTTRGRRSARAPASGLAAGDGVLAADAGALVEVDRGGERPVVHRDLERRLRQPELLLDRLQVADELERAGLAILRTLATSSARASARGCGGTSTRPVGAGFAFSMRDMSAIGARCRRRGPRTGSARRAASTRSRRATRPRSRRCRRRRRAAPRAPTTGSRGRPPRSSRPRRGSRRCRSRRARDGRRPSSGCSRA